MSQGLCLWSHPQQDHSNYGPEDSRDSSATHYAGSPRTRFVTLIITTMQPVVGDQSD